MWDIRDLMVYMHLMIGRKGRRDGGKCGYFCEYFRHHLLGAIFIIHVPFSDKRLFMRELPDLVALNKKFTLDLFLLTEYCISSK